MRSLITASLSVLAFSTIAGADFVDVVYTGKGSGKNVKIVSPGINGDVFAGQLHFTLSNSTAGAFLNGSWTAFCTDLFQHTSSSSNPYQVVPVASLPFSGPMGAAKAAAIGDLYASMAGSQLEASTSDNLACAFQLAIWEIVTDFTGAGPSMGLDITSGGFQATKTTGEALSSGVMGYLADLFGAIGTTNGANLIGLGSESRQDQLIELPEGTIPGPGALATIALGCVLANSRRRRA